jgi:hypothetical protein
MKHKKLFITVAVLIALAIAGGVAYAWWTTSTDPIGGSVGTGSLSLAAGYGPIDVSGLVPQVDPPADPDGALPDSTYPSVSYVWVKNEGTVPLMFYGWLTNGGGDSAALIDYVHVRIWLNPATNNSGWVDTFNTGGNWQVFDGVLSTLWPGQSAGRTYLGSTSGLDGTGVKTPIGPGEQGVYKIAVWLDKNAGNDTQGKTLTFDLKFNGGQEELFDDNVANALYPWTGI